MTSPEPSDPRSVPIQFWIVGILGALYFLAGSVDLARMQLQSTGYMAQRSPAEVEMIRSYSPLFFVILWPVVLGGLAGCVLMLLRRASASLAFLVSVAFAVIHEVQVNLSYDVSSLYSASERILMSASLIGIPAVYYWYARRMKRRGLLEQATAG